MKTISIEKISKRYQKGELYGKGLFGLPFGLAKKKAVSTENNGNNFFWALKDIDLEVFEGDVLGIIGHNGAGKSTLLKILSRITTPTSGRAIINGRVGSLLEVGTGFHPELTGRENIFLNASVNGMKRKSIRQKFDEIVDFSELESHIDTPVKRYSTGMYVKLAFAISAYLDQEILLVDEILSVGDVRFQRKCISKVENVADKGRTVIFVSHNLATLEALCSRGIFMHQGSILYDGSVTDSIRKYLSTVSNSEFSLTDENKTIDLGEIEISDVAVNNGNDDDTGGVLQTGRPFIFRFSWEKLAEYAQITVFIRVFDANGFLLSLLTNRNTGKIIQTPDDTGTVYCSIDRIPLPPGKYHLELEILANLRTILRYEKMAVVTIESGDFYGTGKMSEGAVLIDQNWYTDADLQLADESSKIISLLDGDRRHRQQA